MPIGLSKIEKAMSTIEILNWDELHICQALGVPPELLSMSFMSAHQADELKRQAHWNKVGRKEFEKVMAEE